MFGLLNLNKPAGPSSHDVVALVRRRLGRGVKVGHSGTLDPFAEGVLVVCVGPATRLADHIQSQPKRYTARVVLGATSSTGDPEGEITQVAGPPWPPAETVRQVLAGFVGRIQQVPPAHSAVKVDGRRAYKLARAGTPPRMPPRTVVVHAIELLDCSGPSLTLDVTCGSGTYLRALARDVGAALGVGGYCAALARTAVGTFTIDSAVAPDQFEPARDLLPAVLAVEGLPKIAVDETAARRLAMGQSAEIDPGALAGSQPLTRQAAPFECAVLDGGGDLIAIAKVQGTILRPSKVFATKSPSQ